jgi:hypothetical protein
VERIIIRRGGVHVCELDDDRRSRRQPILPLAAVADTQPSIDPVRVVARTNRRHDVRVDRLGETGALALEAVGLPTNFKAARFEGERETTILRNLESDIESVRYDAGDGPLEIPVKLKVHESVFVPLAKWPMLIAGNYRCIRREEMIPIKEAVHSDAAKSRTVYEWVSKLCHRLGASDEDLVPFEKYAKAAEGLGKPSSAARALFGGAEHIERVDCLVRRIAKQQGLQSDTLDEIVTLVDERLGRNRAVALSR